LKSSQKRKAFSFHGGSSNFNWLLYFFSVVAESSERKEFKVSIEFLTWPIIRYKREVLFGWVDLLVSFGGIAGLFLGFSLLSGVEIIYYFTMRAGCMMYKNRVSEQLCNRMFKLFFLSLASARMNFMLLKRRKNYIRLHNTISA
jgi:hypothetical protein